MQPELALQPNLGVEAISAERPSPGDVQNSLNQAALPKSGFSLGIKPETLLAIFEVTEHRKRIAILAMLSYAALC